MKRFIATSVALASVISVARAQTIYATSDRTLANGNPINSTFGTLYTGVTSGGTLATGVNVDIVAPANGQSNISLQARSDSNVVLRGGSILGFQLSEDSRLTISGGSAGSPSDSIGFVSNARDQSRITVTGGTMYDGFSLSNSATGAITGGTFNTIVSAQDSSRLTVQDGLLNALRLSGTAVADIYGGTYRYSTVPSSQSGSPVPVTTDINGSATMNVYGGNFAAQDVRLFGAATSLNITGGSFGRIEGFQASTINISGGTFNNVLLCNYNHGSTPYAVYNLFGTGFSLTNARAFTLTDQYVNGFTGTMYDIGGTLADGSSLSGRYFVENRTVAQGATGIAFSAPTVVPESNTLALALPALGMVALCNLGKTRRLHRIDTVVRRHREN